ncbi:MAG: HyaD/HybD family hydrogenase maturation endopeptidase [Candidatus Saccharicenans sp.]
MIKTEVPRRKKIMVLGLGNILNHDEGAGVYALKELEKIAPEEIRARAELVDGGVLGMDLLPYVEGASHLLILDAVDSGMEPGDIIEYENDEIELFYHGRLSWHQLGFQEVLAVAKIREKFPEEIHLIGLQPKDISTGLGLSVEVEKAVREMARRALEILTGWLEEIRER